MILARGISCGRAPGGILRCVRAPRGNDNLRPFWFAESYSVRSMEIGPRKTPEHLASFFDLLDEGMALCELVYEGGACVDYLVIDANAQYAIHTGLPLAELIGGTGRTLFGSKEAPYLRECAAAVAERARVRFDVYSARLQRHFSLLVIPMTSMGPRSFGMVLSDIALRKSQEQALEKGRLAQRALLDNQPHLAWLKDVEGHFLAVNRVFAEACGLSSPESLIGKTDLDVWPRELAEAYRADDAAVMAAGRQKAVEEPIASVDGTRWFETYKSPVFAPDGSIVGTTGVARDVTERKKAEHDALRAEEERRKLELSVLQAQKLESLGVLAGGIAHDFNNLLTTILCNADLALSELSLDSPARGFLDDIELATRRAADLCRQMLAYSGKGRFVIQPISLNELVSEMGQLLSVSTSKKARLIHTFAANLPSVMADATQLRQIVMNLITNASEAIGDSEGTIALQTGALSCDRDYFADAIGDRERHIPGIHVFLEVSDTGVGMDADTLGHIFDPFFSTKFAGRGLGLAAVLGIVRGHKGALKVSSEPGKGTTFRVLLPAHGAAAEPGEVTPVAARDFRGHGLVLIADDEAAVRSFARQVLERAGFSVVTAVDGREALELYKRHGRELRLVVLDMTMPHLDGEGCFRALRELNPDAKIVITSGYSEQDVGAQFVGKGLAGFVQKPYKADLLLGKIRDILG
jgi:two-component system, cell cycle sensor histidine kinase and response regulator CckA